MEIRNGRGRTIFEIEDATLIWIVFLTCLAFSGC